MNTSGLSLEIASLSFSWPSSNEELVKIELDGDAIWEAKDSSSPTNIPSESGWKSGANRRIQAMGSTELRFQFDEKAAGSGYGLSITFDSGCTISD